ncbi:MAG: hypothetical protein QM757_38215 [Paludibaculum sp.]
MRILCRRRVVTFGKAAGWGLATVAIVVVAFLGFRGTRRAASFARTMAPAATVPGTRAERAPHPSLIYGRILTVDGVTFEGRLRWGGNQEAFWGDYFNGVKSVNPWAGYVPPEQLPKESRPIVIFGLEIAHREGPLDLSRNFMARFGDIARLDASTAEVKVTLKSGSRFVLNRYSSSDFDDGVQVWDSRQGVKLLDTLRIRTIEFLPGPPAGGSVDRLYGTVRTKQGEEFRGFLQWDREQCLGSDLLTGEADGAEGSIRFDAVRSIARRSGNDAVVTLLDGREVVLTGERGFQKDRRGVYIDDPRYGRVLVSWTAFVRVEFAAGGDGPAYGDFPPGGPLQGSVTTRDGRRLSGRLVYDLDESEFTDTLDAPSQGVTYTIPFGLIASIVRSDAGEKAAECGTVTLWSGEALHPACAGDLGRENAGALIFGGAQQQPEYVPWANIGHVELDRPPAIYPPTGKR